jgi:Ca-activated chloride channel family protein
VPTDDDSIRRIADLSGGQFYDAGSAGQLNDIVNTLGEQIGYETKRADASKPWLIAGTLAAVLAAASALAIGQRLP